MATIIERGDDQHQVKWRPGRGAKWETCTLHTSALADQAKQLAEAHRHKITAEDVLKVVLQLPADQRPTTPTLADWVAQWLRRKANVQPDTLKEYERMLSTRVLPTMGRRRLADIDRDAIADWVASMTQELAPASVRRYHAVLHQVLADAVGKHISDNPAAPPKGQRKNGLPKLDGFEACFLTPAECALVVDNCPDQIRPMVRVALGTGMRLGELIALRVKDVDLDGRTPAVKVERALKLDGTVGVPKSKRSRRTIRVSKALVDVLRPLVADKRPNDMVFPAPMGGLWSRDNFRERYWKRAVAAAQRCSEHPPAPKPDRRGRLRDDPFATSTCGCSTRLHQTPRFHDMRHTHVGLLLEAGWDLYDIQLRIGHESIKTTFDVYGHKHTHGDAARLDALDSIMADPSVVAPGATSAADVPEAA